MMAKLRIGLYALALVTVWVVMGLASSSRGRKPVQEVRVVLEEGRESFFLDAAAVKSILEAKQGGKLEGTPAAQVHVTDLEYELDRNPWVGNAEVYLRNGGILTAEIRIRKPLARVIASNGVSFYLDENFRKFPVSEKYPADVPLITGEIVEELSPEDSLRSAPLASMRELITEIHQDEFLSAMVAEIRLDAKGEAVIYPEIGSLEVYFGKPEKVREKFNRLMKFYDQVIAITGWNEYASVDLRYEGQIVARKL